MNEKTFSDKTSRELYVLLGKLTLFALAEKYGYDFPLKIGKFIEEEAGREKYSLEESPERKGAGRATARVAEDRTFKYWEKPFFGDLPVF